jgi:hypothetical protein
VIPSIIIVKGANQGPTMLKDVKAAAKEALAARGMNVKVAVVSAHSRKIQNALKGVDAAHAGKKWLAAGAAATVEYAKRYPSLVTAMNKASNVAQKADKVLATASEAIEPVAEALAPVARAVGPVAKAAGPVMTAISAATNISTLVSSKSTTGQKVVAPLELAPTVLSVMPATAVVGGVWGVGLVGLVSWLLTMLPSLPISP